MLVKHIFLSIAVLFLTGCSTVRSPDLNVTDREVIYVKVPDSLLVECKPNAPMPPDAYMALTLDERELTLSKYILTLYGTIAVCNGQLNKIKKYSDNNGGGSK